MTGSAIAIPLLGATGASAASGTTWDQVAQCVSGGSWSADTGNGRYGGLQLTQDDWDKYGGLDYATSPDQASRSQQIAVAEKILAARGVSVWGTCGLLNGLSKDSGSADVDTGVAGDASSGSGSASDSGVDSGLSESSGSSGPSGSSTSDSPSTFSSSSPGSPSSSPSADSTKSDTASTATTKGDESDKSGRNEGISGSSGSDAPGAGRHRGDSADEGAADGRTGDRAGRHASRDTSGARDSADGSYTVRPGDSLSTIADSLDLKGGWAALYEANKGAVGADPNLILPGQSLALDAEPTGGRP